MLPISGDLLQMLHRTLRTRSYIKLLLCFELVLREKTTKAWMVDKRPILALFLLTRILSNDYMATEHKQG
ncbi:hypothetical protein T06_14527 [Trichinella sp. T6]|nr:hypothetical protein T06_1571 [Trichinella sp. T6]KRX54879.1 hypothetical protein T06_14527 [Trichinella sp. T6]